MLQPIVREYPWFVNGVQYDGTGCLALGTANDPDIYHGLDADRVGAMQTSTLKLCAGQEAGDTQRSQRCSRVRRAWGKNIPDLKPEEAEEKYGRRSSKRRARPNRPVAAWASISSICANADYMQARKYSALHYKAPNADFTLGLPSGHKWISAQSLAENGVVFTANMPTEEIFTLPDRHRADGTVTSTFPLSYGGSLIEDFSVTFENGRIVRVNAKKNEAILQKLVATDEGATRLGEVALVPASSPIARRGHLFYNTLFDENASCHIAIGRAYRFTLTGGEELTDEEFNAAGGNTSLTHVDFMIGSPHRTSMASGKTARVSL
jgi:aminopeptidase